VYFLPQHPFELNLLRAHDVGFAYFRVPYIVFGILCFSWVPPARDYICVSVGWLVGWCFCDSATKQSTFRVQINKAECEGAVGGGWSGNAGRRTEHISDNR